MKLLMIDNYDSFTYNLVQLFYEFDIAVVVYRNDKCDVADIFQEKPDWICISPGPKTPGEAGISKEVIVRFSGKIPILGICLGMQAINEVFGGVTVKAPTPRHGKLSRIIHRGEGIFQGIPSPFWAARYHSLQVKILSPEILSVAYAEDGVIMGIQHKSLPVYGLQFHPESFMSEYGHELVANFLYPKPGRCKLTGYRRSENRD